MRSNTMNCSYELVFRFNHILICCYVSVMYILPSYIYSYGLYYGPELAGMINTHGMIIVI